MVKNRNRSKHSFANINLLGKCNFDCRWCLGKDLPELEQYDNLNQHFGEWPNFTKFVRAVQKNNVKQIYITGQNTDSLRYKYLKELIGLLQEEEGFFVGLRSNGLLAEKKMDIVNMATTCFADAVSFTVLTRDKNVHKSIVGHKRIPNWDRIIPAVKVPLRVSIVIDRYNFIEFFDLVKYLSKFRNIKYIQVRKISTDTRQKEFKYDQHIYEALHDFIVKTKFEKINEYESAVSYKIHGMECSFWRTVNTTVNSLNYFTNGVVSDQYFIIEGYLNNKHQLV